MADQEYTTVLGPDVAFKGELSFEKGLKLQGTIEGQVKTPGRLHIDREAKITGDVAAGAVNVEGQVRGNITASDRIELRSTANYEGDLEANKLTVEEGAVFQGMVSVGPGSVKAQPGQVAGVQTSQPDRPAAQRPAQAPQNGQPNKGQQQNQQAQKQQEKAGAGA